MGENYYLGAYWGNRPESAGECARRVQVLLRDLSHCDATLGQWFEKGGSRAHALKRPVSYGDEQVLSELLEKSCVRRRAINDVASSLGFRIGLWSGAPDSESSALSVSCGGSASTSQAWVPNSCVIDLPQEGAPRERLLRVSVLLEIVGAVVKALEPDWGVVTSDAARRMMPESEPGTPLVGWITYLKGLPGTLGLLPGYARVLPVGGSGSALVITDKVFTAENPQDAKATTEVRAALEKAGVLRRPR
jgi:hypothetical protein